MSVVEVYERVGKLLNHFVKRPKRANRYIYGSEKVEKTFFCDIFKFESW